MIHSQPCRGVTPGGAVLSGKNKCNLAKNYENITEKFKNCTNFDMLVKNGMSEHLPPPPTILGKEIFISD